MLCEYAVEPRAIGSSWERFRYLIEKFGFDRGRLVSRFPETWLRLAYEASADLGPLERKRIEEGLVLAKRNKMARTRRQYDSTKSWIENSIAQDALSPFQAIIALENAGGLERILAVDSLDETHPLMNVANDWPVVREAATLASAFRLMLQSSNVVLFVDQYYDPFNSRYQTTLRECLKIVHAANPGATCEIHYGDRSRAPPVSAIIREARDKFRTVIPAGMMLTLFRWREKPGGQDLHARYLLTETGGIRVDAGFSAEGEHQTTDVSLMDFELSQQCRARLRAAATTFELVRPILKISARGDVQQFF
jgi:hypothetical protein